MKKALLLLVMLFPVYGIAQSTFTVTGSGRAFKDGDKIYLAYKEGNTVKGDSVVVYHNKFKIKGTIDYKAQGTLYKNENPFVADIIHDAATIYIEPGNIFVTSQDSLRHAVISGTASNADYAELTASLRPLQEKLIKLSIAYDALTAEQQKDMNFVAPIRQQIREINKQMEPVQFAFIKSHPRSYISLLTLQKLSNDPALLPKVNEAYDRLTSSAKKSSLGKSLSKKIEALKTSALGIMAMDFSQPDINGRAVKLSDFRGKYVLIDFWASWCIPCRNENPSVVSAYKKYKNKGFTVLGISLDDQRSKKEWLGAIKADGLTWTQVSDLKGWKNEVSKRYGIEQIPANILIDPSGKIIARNLKDKVLLDTLKELLD